MKKLLILIAIVSFIVLACKKEPKVESSNFSITNEEIVKGTTSVAVTVTYSYPSVLERVDGYISANNDMSNSNKVRATINQNTFTLRFNDLQANTHYYYQYEYSTGVDTYKTDISSFTTNDYAAPMVETADVTNITATAAQCGGEVIDDGGLGVTARGICWSNNTNPTIDDYHTSNGTGSGSFTSNMTDLAIKTIYYVRAYATNSKGTSYGDTKEFTTTDGKPTVITNEVTDITGTSAKCGGNVTYDGGFPVTERGVCWSTSQNPTITNSHTSDGTGSGSYTSNITNLNGSTTYYLRAYATNSKGTSYGEQKTCQTLYAPPVGSINGLFSISATQKVFFSKGNLQYQASTNTWRFAENQYDYVGDNNANISSSYNGWIDLFGWGTSGYNHGARCYQPWSTSTITDNYSAYGNCFNNLNDDTGQADWGYNAISNGGNTISIWRTLTRDEWNYLVNTRSANSGMRYVKAVVNGINGVIIFPDNWSSTIYSFNSINDKDAYYSHNVIDETIMVNTLEQNGAVFLPAAGSRTGVTISNVNESGCYWSATAEGINAGISAYVFTYYDSDLEAYWFTYYRRTGLSVRLVQDY